MTAPSPAPLDLDALERTAKAVIAEQVYWPDEQMRSSDFSLASCNYIAAANPAVVLALIARLRVAEARNEVQAMEVGK